MSHPPPGPPWPPVPPDPNQPQYGGYPGGPAQDPNYSGQPYGGGPGYPQQSYTTEPPYSGQPYPDQAQSGQPYQGDAYGAAQQPGYEAGYPQAQPYSGAPYGEQPYSGQPYGGQAYGAQPLSGQPYGAQPYVAPQPPRRGRGGLIALLVGGAVLVLLLCGVGGVVLVTSGNNKPTAEPTRSTAPSASTTASRAPSASPSATTKPDYPATITLPTTLAGLTKLENAALTKQADETAAKIKTETNGDTAIAGYYAPAGDATKTVGLVGVTVKIDSPATELDRAFSGTLAVNGAREVNPGPMGGLMKCGNTSSGGNAMSVCGWADGGSLVIGIFLNRSVDDSAALLRQIRSEILRRG